MFGTPRKFNNSLHNLANLPSSALLKYANWVPPESARKLVQQKNVHDGYLKYIGVGMNIKSKAIQM